MDLVVLFSSLPSSPQPVSLPLHVSCLRNSPSVEEKQRSQLCMRIDRPVRAVPGVVAVEEKEGRDRDCCSDMGLQGVRD